MVFDDTFTTVIYLPDNQDHQLSVTKIDLDATNPQITLDSDTHM